MTGYKGKYPKSSVLKKLEVGNRNIRDEEALSLGVYNTFTQDNLRYSQNAPLNMYDEVNT